MAILPTYGNNFSSPFIKTPSKENMMSTVGGPAKGYVTSAKQPIVNNIITASPVPQKQMMSYNVKLKNPSKKYNGLEKSDEEYIDSTLEKSGVNGIEKDMLREQAVKTFVQVKQAKAFLADREGVRTDLVSGKLNLGTKEDNDITYKTSQFADLIRKDALSSGTHAVTQTDDKAIIDAVLQQRPDIQDVYDRFLNGDTTISNVSRVLQGGSEVKGAFGNWLADTIGPAIQKGATAIFGKDAVQQYQQENKQKSFSDVALKDMGAAPSVVVGAATVPAKQIVNLLGGDGAKVNDVVDYLGVQQDGRFNAGKIASEIGVSAIEASAGMKLLNIGQLGAVLKNSPKIAKYIVKPVLEAVGFTAATDLVKGELSTAKEFAGNVAMNVAFAGLGGLLGGKTIEKGVQTAAKDVPVSTIDDYIKSTKELKNNFKSQNPLNKLITKVDDAIKGVDSDKGVVGKTLGDMRNKMKTVTYSMDDAVNEINTSLKNNNIGASIIKDNKGVYKISSKISKDSGKTAVLQEMVNSLNEGTSKTLGIKNKIAALDKLNQDLIYTVKKQAAGSTLGNALSKASKTFSTTIDDVMSKYGFIKGEYSKLAELKNSLKAISSEGKGAQTLLSKVSGPGAPEEIKNILQQLKELGYTNGDDIFSEAIVANKIMKTILSPGEFEQALNNAYPSIPGLMELGIKAAKSAVSKPLRALRSYAPGYVPSKARGVIGMGTKYGPMQIVGSKKKE